MKTHQIRVPARRTRLASPTCTSAHSEQVGQELALTWLTALTALTTLTTVAGFHAGNVFGVLNCSHGDQ